MFEIDKDTKTIHINRGDVGTIKVFAQTNENEEYEFQSGDIVRLSVYEKGNYDNLVMMKQIETPTLSKSVEIHLNSDDTTIGDIINKEVTYWYEVELNPDSMPQTIIGHDKNGAKEFVLYPEGGNK